MDEQYDLNSLADLRHLLLEVSQEQKLYEAQLAAATEQNVVAYAAERRARKEAFKRFMESWDAPKPPAAAAIEQAIDAAAVEENCRANEYDWRCKTAAKLIYSCQKRASNYQTLINSLIRELESEMYNSHGRDAADRSENVFLGPAMPDTDDEAEIDIHGEDAATMEPIDPTNWQDW